MSRKCLYCVSLKTATMACALMSLIFSMSMITASATSISYDSSMSPFVVTAFLVNGIAGFVSSILCIRGVCTESSHYLLPWIFTVSVGTVFMFLVSISYMMYDVRSHTIFGVILFILAVFFAAGWICVINYYYQLYDKKNETQRSRRRLRMNPTAAVNTEISRTSFSSIVLEDYRSPPPPYSVATIEKDKDLPSYEEIFTGAESNRRF